MAITPHQLDLWSSNMAHLYQSLEGELIRLIAKRLNSGHANILEWQREKLQELYLFNKDAIKAISQITGIAETEIKKMFESSGEKIVKDVDGQLPYDSLPLPNDLDSIMKSYHEQVWSEIDNYVNQTLLSTNFGYGTATTQMYSEIINKTTAAYNSGLFTFEEALEKTVQQWAQKGIKSAFIDKGGHTWSLERYVRTVLKSTLANTYDTLRKDRMSEYGVHTILVTSHMGARHACSKIQGHVVDLRQISELPSNWKYRSIYDPYWQAEYGTSGGHRGVNCLHLHIPYIPGVSTNNQPKFDSKENKKVAELTKKQRYLERQIVKYKKNKMVSEALGQDSNAKEWTRKIRATQSRLRKLVDSNDYLNRNYSREKVYTPINTLLKDFRYDDF
ncbi:phage minor capsid protein [Enterococcus sp. C65]|uniref:phage minor capsid protein n=1 Tax=Enterococcus TaxID=1350 RepID=UPI0034A08E37